MVRRYLGFSIDEWRHLPWWQQRVYLEELNADFSGEGGEEEGSVGDLIEMGIDVRRVDGGV